MCGRPPSTSYEVLASLDVLVGWRLTFVGVPRRIRNGIGSPVSAAVAIVKEGG
jgi:kynurenine formamidase